MSDPLSSNDLKGGLDLTLGNPSFLREVWEKHNPKLASDMSYNKDGFLVDLEIAILFMHERFSNLGDIVLKDYSLVVGAGASQVLLAAQHAMKSRDVKYVYAKPPYWLRFPIITELAGLKFNLMEAASEHKEALEIVTSLNNPDGDLNVKKIFSKYTIHDACYYWDWYAVDKKALVKHTESDVILFSLAKATGHAASRIGWAFVKDKELAKDMQHYIELTTGGVSVDAQNRAVKVLNSFSPMMAKEAKDVLVNRRRAFIPDLRESRGMFLYTGEKPSGEVHGITSDNFGEDYPDKIRYNIGCTEFEFQQLKKAYK